VYQSGEKLNVADPYNDPRFNKETDKKTGYKTESILCLPILDAGGDTVAVLQAINKKSDSKFTKFTEDDEMVMEHMAMQVGVILSNQLLSERTKRIHAQVMSLLEIVKSLHSNMGINSLMFTITEKSPSLVDADRCTLYLVDRARNELWSLQGAIEVRVPMDKGLIGACASAGEILNIKDAWEDARFNKDFDKQTGYRTRSVLCMPIRDAPQDGTPAQMVGVLQLINKLSAPQFLQEDELLLQSFVDIAGTVLSASQLFQSVKKKDSEFSAAADLHPAAITRNAEDRKSFKKSASKAQMKTFQEVEEEEENEET
jgi:adenylate cyclase